MATQTDDSKNLINEKKQKKSECTKKHQKQPHK